MECDYCEEEFPIWKMTYRGGLELCEKCVVIWDNREIEPEGVKPVENYKPNPDYLDFEEGECDKCND